MQGQTQRAGTASDTLFRVVLWVQASYYLVTAVWPMVSMESFMAVTGPKTDNLPSGRPPDHPADHWLVLTAAVLILAVGLSLLVAAWRGSRTVEVAVLAVAAAIGLSAIDVIFVARGVIPPVYLLDAVAEAILLAGWLVVGVTALAARRGPVSALREAVPS